MGNPELESEGIEESLSASTRPGVNSHESSDDWWEKVLVQNPELESEGIEEPPGNTRNELKPAFLDVVPLSPPLSDGAVHPVGTLVSVQGLQSATQHNGKTGEIVEYDAAKTMYIVKLNADSNGTARHEDEMISVKPINLHLHLPRSVSKEGAPVLGLNDDEDDDINANDNDAELELEDVESTSHLLPSRRLLGRVRTAKMSW